MQAAYYALTGAWPIVHMPSFEAVTGPKVDDWLVHVVGLLTVSIAAALWPRGRREVPPAVRLLALASAASFLVIDVVYATLGVIRPIYLADAALQAGFLLAHAALPYPAGAVHPAAGADGSPEGR
ncbi:MAG TPA: hypothetical protein VFQ22_10675 [Longimicrobiales bacterium]|nr:hypothetical protein [Longimicrobiales bacterium]